jgi:hypothetical protein
LFYFLRLALVLRCAGLLDHENDDGTSNPISAANASTVTAMKASSPSHVIPLVLLKVVALLIAILGALSRRDVLCFGYIIPAAMMAFRVDVCDVDSSRRGKLWKILRRYNCAVLFLHMVWILPGVTVTWDAISRRREVSTLLNLASAFGLRFGLGMKLESTDPRISAWDFEGNGIVYDVLLFAVLRFQEQLSKVRKKNSRTIVI